MRKPAIIKDAVVDNKVLSSYHTEQLIDLGSMHWGQTQQSCHALHCLNTN